MDHFFKCYRWLLVCTLLLISSSTLAKELQSNILWITSEDMSPNLSLYGDNTAHTPNLEMFAGSGVCFKNVYATSPVCSPSRSTLITGVYASTLGTHHHRSKVPLQENVKTLPELLRSAGYFCTNNVKTDYNFPVPDGMWDENSKKAHWRHRSNPDQPFFSVFNFTVTHESFSHQSDEKFKDRVKDVKAEHQVKPDEVKLPPYIPDTPVMRKEWARYYDTISQLDVEVGRLLQQLADDGLSSTTVVFFFSDHGQGLPRGKRWLYNSGLQVPLVVRWPTVLEPGAINNDLISLIDLPPTVLSIAGIKKPAYMPGRVFTGPDEAPEPDYIFATRDRMGEVHDMSRSVQNKKYKYIKNFYPERPYSLPQAYMDLSPAIKEWRRLNSEGALSGPQALFFQPEKPAEELYDMKQDPHEIHNLASNPQYADELKGMRQKLNNWQTATKDRGMEPEPEANIVDKKPKKRK